MSYGPEGVVETWATAESLAVLGELEMWIGEEMMTRWEQLEFSQNASASVVSFEAYAAVKTQKLIDDLD